MRVTFDIVEPREEAGFHQWRAYFDSCLYFVFCVFWFRFVFEFLHILVFVLFFTTGPSIGKKLIPIVRIHRIFCLLHNWNIHSFSFLCILGVYTIHFILCLSFICICLVFYLVWAERSWFPPAGFTDCSRSDFAANIKLCNASTHNLHLAKHSENTQSLNRVEPDKVGTKWKVIEAQEWRVDPTVIEMRADSPSTTNCTIALLL